MFTRCSHNKPMRPHVASMPDARRARCGSIIVAGLVVIAAAGSARLCSGQTAPAIVTAKMVLATDAVHSGSAARAAVVAEIAPGYHINEHHPTLSYLIPTELKFEPDKQFTVEKVSYPKGKLQKFVFAENGLSVYQGRLVIPVMLQTASGVEPGNYTLGGQLSYQACNANACFPPASAAFALPVHVVAAGARLKSAHPGIFGKHE